MVLEHVIQHPNVAGGHTLQILTDSQTTVAIITQGWKSNSYKGAMEEIKKAIKILQSEGTSMDLQWTLGHSGLQGNEKADQLAKEAAEETRSKQG